MSSVGDLVSKINTAIIIPIIGVLIALALLYFVWGLVQFIINSDSDEGRATGRQHMLWGIFGIFVMVGVLGILSLLTNTFLR